jgi:hypothetical protein
LLAGVPAIALAGAGAAFAVHGSGAPAATRPSVLTAAYVTKQAEAALGQAGHYIVQTTQQMPGASVITWSDPVTGNDRQLLKGTGSTIIQWSESYRAGNYMHWKITATDTGNRTWYRDTVRASAPMQREPSSSPVTLSPFTSPAQIKEALTSGQVAIAGKGTVNGQAAVDLRLTEKNTQLNYWVNAQTYQPVRMDAWKAVIGIAWLPRTKSLVRQANTPQIPADFRRVSAPAPQ